MGIPIPERVMIINQHRKSKNAPNAFKNTSLFSLEKYLIVGLGQKKL
jgi:hypothetical protein